MSQPYYTTQPTDKYYPQNGPYYPVDGYTGGQPYARETVYIEEPAPRNDWWLTSLLALCCGCLYIQIAKIFYGWKNGRIEEEKIRVVDKVVEKECSSYWSLG
ncbi:hypothetical protein OESDEN_02600 [Oesophagostomum dentatum]|uniref:Uncharacterized protein n=1 Tax=Oesophagostomum dentatum TaxID=61180 RepID=A0A0B1TJI9_OESDE|nr:hypothetical protein OESDEN_02600 [Oesophagostomum dentatum]